MINRILISPLNNHRFLPDGESLEGTRYNTFQFDRAWFSELILRWQQRVEYEQMIQNNDRLSLQVFISAELPVGVNATVTLFSCSGEEIKSISFDRINIPKFDIRGTNYFAHNISDNTFWSDVEEGRYYLVMSITQTGEMSVFVSEPIRVKEKHEGTLLLEVTNSKNKDLVIFEQTGQKFSYRFEGAIFSMTPEVERVSFIDSEYNTTQLEASAFRGWTLWMPEMPDYLLDKINHAFTLSTTRIDGKSYVPADGASIAKQEHENYPLYTNNIELRESDIQKAYTFQKGTIELFTVPAFPFVVLDTRIGYSNISEFVYNVPTYFVNNGSVTAYVAALNAAKIQQGVNGMFSLSSGTVIYTPSSIEEFDYGTSTLLAKRMLVSSTVASANILNLTISLIADITGGKSGYAIADPSNTIESYGLISGFAPTIYTSPYVSGAAGTFQHQIFHDETMGAISLTGDNLTAVGGDSPLNLKSFSIFNSPKLLTFSILAALNRSRGSLISLILNNNENLDNVQGIYDSFLGWYMNSLKTIDLRLNSISTSSLNSLMNETYSGYQAGLFTTTYGTIRLNGQNPPAPVTLTGTGNVFSAYVNLKFTMFWDFYDD